MKRSFYFCRCFLRSNIYLNKLRTHVEYRSRERFKLDYAQILRGKSANDVDEILNEIEKEINLRRTRFEDRLRRRRAVSSSYNRLYPEIFHFQEKFLHPDFLELVQMVKLGTGLDDLPHVTIISKEKRLYGFPVFANDFVDKLNQELANFEASPLEKGRPNSMNNYGISLDELGFDDFLNQLRVEFLDPVSNMFYPEWTLREGQGPALDSHRAFTVQYHPDGDLDLHQHFDNAEVTLNVYMTDDHLGGQLYFCDMVDVPLDESTAVLLDPLPKGHGLLHRGQQIHGALSISEGLRQNLIIWMRCSSLRNHRCPMCSNKPDLELAPEETSGDGFTANSSNDEHACHVT